MFLCQVWGMHLLLLHTILNYMFSLVIVLYVCMVFDLRNRLKTKGSFFNKKINKTERNFLFAMLGIMPCTIAVPSLVIFPLFFSLYFCVIIFVLCLLN